MNYNMQPPPGSPSGNVTSQPVAGRVYVCDAMATIPVPDFDMPSLRGQGWVVVPNVAPLGVTVLA